MSNIKLFKDKQIRAEWNAEAGDLFFSVVDIVSVLTSSVNPTDYLKKLRKRDTLLGDYLGTNCPQVEMLTETGKLRKTLADIEDILGISAITQVNASTKESLEQLPHSENKKGIKQ